MGLDDVRMAREEWDRLDDLRDPSWEWIAGVFRAYFAGRISEDEVADAVDRYLNSGHDVE